MTSVAEARVGGPAGAALPPAGLAGVRDLPAPGVEIAELVVLLLGHDAADLADVDLLGVVAGWPRTPSRPVDDLACALSTTSYAASALVSRADGLATHPVLADALRAGVLDQRKVDVLLDEVARLPREAADDVLRTAVAEGEGLTAPLLRRATRRLVAAVDPDAARKRAEKGRDERCVRLDWADDSMAWVTALLPAPDAVAVFSVVDAMAEAAHTADDPRTVAQRRADAFTDVFADILATGRTPHGGRLPYRQGVAPGVHLTLAATTLAGHDDLPGELAGYGPIPAAMARELAGHATRYRPALIDPDGHLLALGDRTIPFRAPADAVLRRGVGARAETGAAERRSVAPGAAPIGPVPEPAGSGSAAAASADVGGAPPGAAAARAGGARTGVAPPPVGAAFPEELHAPRPGTGYAPGAALRRFVVARDETCMFPGCRQPATSADLDHVDPYDPERSAVEQTIAANLQPLCRHHHRSKTHHGWRMRRDPRTGDVHTTSPDGITYTRIATTVLVTKRALERALARSGGAPTNVDPPPPF